MSGATGAAPSVDPDAAADVPDLAGPVEPSPVAVLLAGLAVGDVDVDRARHVVGLRAGRRLRRRRVVLGCLAAVLVVAVGFVLWPRAEPRKVIAADDTTTTTSTTVPSTTTTIAPPITVVAPTTVVATTKVAPTVTTVPATLATTTTLAPNRPMTVSATVSVAGGSLVVGNAVTLNVSWNDPDLADPSSVVISADFGDPLVGLPAVSAPRPPCDAPGNGASGTSPITFRYASSGAVTVRVVVTACGGAGRYGEQQSIEIPLQLQPPPAGRRAVVIGGGDGRSPDTAAVLAGTETVSKRDPEMTQVLPNSTTRATVAVIDAAYSGPLYLRWGDPPTTNCQVTAANQSVAAGVTPARSLLAPGLVSCPAQKLMAGSPASP